MRRDQVTQTLRSDIASAASARQRGPVTCPGNTLGPGSKQQKFTAVAQGGLEPLTTGNVPPALALDRYTFQQRGEIRWAF